VKIVCAIDDLLTLPRNPRVNGFGLRESLQLELPGIPRRDQISAQARLNRLQARCGCAAGGITTFLALIVGALYLRHASPGVSWRFLTIVIGVLLVAFTAGFAAKLFTLALTRLQFTCECRALHRALSASGQGEEQDVDVHALGR
jgi:hypothetical protein